MLKEVYRKHIILTGREIPFRILLSFLITFILARLTVYSIVNDILPNLFFIVNGVHVHHLNYGIFLLAVSGYFALTLSQNQKWIKRIATIYGIGLGLTFDEFGMWLHLRDDYWMRQSYDAIVVVGVVLLNGMLFGGFWMDYCIYCINRLKDRKRK